MPARPSRPSLSIEIAILVTSLIALTWYGAARGLAQSWLTLSLAQRVVSANERIDLLLQAAQNLAFVRGRTNVLLSSASPPRPGDREFLSKRRNAAEAALNALSAQAASFPDGGYSSIAAMRGAYEALCARAEAEMAMAAGDRDRAFSETWFAGSSLFIDEIVNAATMVAFGDNSYPAAYIDISRLEVDAIRLRLSLGAESSGISAALAARRSIGEEEYAHILLLKGQSLANWGEVQLGRRIAKSAEINSSIERVKIEYFEKYRPLQDGVLKSLRGAQPTGLGMAASTLTDASVPALDSLASLLSLLTDETRKVSERFLSASLGDLIRQALVAALALSIGSLALSIVFFRLLGPMRRLSEQLNELAKGNLDGELPAVGHHDEMAFAQAAILDFRESLLERRKLIEQLEALGNSDSLTGLANRRSLDAALKTEWQRALRLGSTLALVMIDIDHFKNFNDTRGHLAGDECLRRVASLIAAHARRPGDFAARFGGEEFLIVLPDVDREGAVSWADTLRRAVEDLDVLPDCDTRVGVTISCGVASVVPDRGLTIPEFIGLADAALYKAKAGGRNRVEIDPF